MVPWFIFQQEVPLSSSGEASSWPQTLLFCLGWSNSGQMGTAVYSSETTVTQRWSEVVRFSFRQQCTYIAKRHEGAWRCHFNRAKRLVSVYCTNCFIALIVRAFPTCLQAGDWSSRRFRASVALLCHLRKLHVILPFCMWLPCNSIAHRGEPHGLNRAVLGQYVLQNRYLTPFWPVSAELVASPFPLLPRFLLSASLLGVLSWDLLAGSWIFLS